MAGTKEKKSRRETPAEKKRDAQIRKELREEGILPPFKKRLNRRRFIEEAQTFLKESNSYELNLYIQWALMEMTEHKAFLDRTPDLEAVGAAKVIKLAQRRMEFERRRREQGETTYQIRDLIEAVRDIYEA